MDLFIFYKIINQLKLFYDKIQVHLIIFLRIGVIKCYLNVEQWKILNVVYSFIQK
jgi:hypothetical protein